MNECLVQSLDMVDTAELSDAELAAIDGGNWWAPIAIAASAYIAMLGKIEQYPGDYTWTMDWYYGPSSPGSGYGQASEFFGGAYWGY